MLLPDYSPRMSTAIQIAAKIFGELRRKELRRYRAVIRRLQRQNGELERALSLRAEEDRTTVPEWKVCRRCEEPWVRRVDGELRCWYCDG
jgi:hypothetical protein